DHRRAGSDARLPGLARAAYRRGRTARRYDERRGDVQPPSRELRALAGCAWHTVRRRCANGVVMGAHAAGRIAEALDPAPVGGPDFVSGRSGTVVGRRAALAAAADVALDAREAAFVEIGPVTAFHRDTFEALLPFPDLRMGWGLDLHWAALARERGWRMGVVDAVAIAHRARPAGVGYDREGAVAEAREFL